MKITKFGFLSLFLQHVEVVYCQIFENSSNFEVSTLKFLKKKLLYIHHISFPEF